jgi:hypothetical protein
MNGIYLGYMTGMYGNGLALILIREGVIVGADAGGMMLDGSYSSAGHGYHVKVAISIPPGCVTIHGIPSGEKGLRYEVEANVPSNLESVPFLTFPTPFGPVNCRFKKIRDV